jgi:urease accessory protein
MNNELLHLLQLCDPALPIGGFSHSAGLETYVQKGIVINKETVSQFLHEMLANNIFYNDGAYVSLAMKAAAEKDLHRIIEIDQLANATKIPEEIRMASIKLSSRLLKIFQPVCNEAMIKTYQLAVAQKKINGHYAVTFGIIANALGINKEDALMGFFYNAAAGIVTNSVKLIPLSQQTGQEILFEIKSTINNIVNQIDFIDEDLIGVCAVGFDIASMEHEHLYSRLYMS